MASPQSQSGNGVRYTLIYQDASSLPNDNVGGQAFNLSNPVPAGLIEQVGFRISGTCAAYPSTASAAEVISGIRFTLNGDQLFNVQTQANATTNAGCSRLGAMVQDIGGGVVEDPSSPLAVDMTVWIPVGVNAPVNSRFELALNYITALSTITGNFEIWIKYGKSTNLTLLTNQTSQTIADGAQTMVSVKIPSIKGATVAGIMVQGARASDNMTAIIPKVLGDFAFSPTYLRGLAGITADQYYFADDAGSATAQEFQDAIDGYYFVPLYNAVVSDGSVVLLITSTTDEAGANSEFYTFTPVLNLPTSGSGERTPRQTAGVATGSKGAILSRAEDL
jgi:hypothetical protein